MSKLTPLSAALAAALACLEPLGAAMERETHQQSLLFRTRKVCCCMMHWTEWYHCRFGGRRAQSCFAAEEVLLWLGSPEGG